MSLKAQRSDPIEVETLNALQALRTVEGVRGPRARGTGEEGEDEKEEEAVVEDEPKITCLLASVAESILLVSSLCHCFFH